MESEMTTPKRGDKRIKGRVAIACTECRNQHLRCDAITPTCSRCRNLHKTCVYMDLRRSRRRHAEVEKLVPSEHHNDDLTAVEASDIPAVYQQSHLSEEPRLLSRQSSPLPTFVASSNALQPTVFADNDLLSTRPVDGFYRFFFPGHPFILPQAHLMRHFEKTPDFSYGLVLMIAFIGSLYTHDSLANDYRQQAERALGSQLAPHGFNVQALMLLALTLEWSGENERAAMYLERAKTMGLEIGIHRRDFASRCGHGDKVLEESWRRTWWELYVIDALFAGIRHLPTFTSWGVDTDVEIPCEEKLYVTGMIPQPRTLREYDNRGFDDSDESFSSFAYLIDATRILGTTLAAGDIANKSAYSLVKNAEANLMSWDLHLPHAKRDPVQSDGTLDEVLFKAHMAINTTSTHLHRPRSMLHYTTMELLCSKYAPPLPAEVLSAEEQHQDRHTHKAINAAKNFVDLLTASSSPLTHSPFVMFLDQRDGAGRIDFPSIQAMPSFEEIAFDDGLSQEINVADMGKDWGNLMENI
ncbi:transcriptional regulator family: Fungal Specific TF [Trichoderma harzianum]|nr:transcriptional regulator family: Fungal Specific TF [Trichoderma harzianum]